MSHISQGMKYPPLPKAQQAIKPSPPLPSCKQLNRSKSQQNFVKGKSQPSPDKKMRLRDYLFVASASSNHNNIKKQSLKSSLSPNAALKQSLTMLKKQKYQVSNSEMHQIVSKQLISQFQSTIKDLKDKYESFRSSTCSNPSKQDLKYLYNIRRVLNDQIKPALKQLDELAFKNRGDVIKEIIRMGLEMGTKTIKQEENEEDGSRNNSNKNYASAESLMKSLLFGASEKS